MLCRIHHLAPKSFVVLVVIATNFVCGSVYHITPSCPDLQSCLDLSELATIDFSSWNDTNITLLFLPGNHSLDRELVLSNKENVFITTTNISEATRIECTSKVGRVAISNVAEVMIESLQFVGCGGNSISTVDKFEITSSIFTDVAGNGTALILNGTSVASINACSFVNNTGGTVQWLHSVNYKVGGAVLASNSNVWMNDTLFVGNGAELGGAIFIEKRSNISIESCSFRFHCTINDILFIRDYRLAYNKGGVIYTLEASVYIANCSFIENTATGRGGVIYAYKGIFSITNSTFFSNTATWGGVIYSDTDASFHIAYCSFIINAATTDGGVIYAYEGDYKGNFTIISSVFIKNTATKGGVVYYDYKGNLTITSSTFISNTATSGGVIYSTTAYASFHITYSTFIGNVATNGSGGVVYINHGGTFYIANSSFTNNKATGRVKYKSGGVIYAYAHTSWEGGLSQIYDSHFTYNSADTGGVMYIFRGYFQIANSTFSENTARKLGIIYLVGSLYPGTDMGTSNHQSSLCHIDSSTFSSNFAKVGVVTLFYASIKFSGTTNFVDNVGSLYIYNSNLTLSGLTKFKNCTDPELVTYTLAWSDSQGGAITSILSNVLFTGKSQLLHNTAISGGGILAFESTISISGPTKIADNQATGDGGGISLHHSRLVIIGVRCFCNIIHNNAIRGGGVHGISSTIIVNQPSVLHIINNSAEDGGGLYFEGYAKIEMMNLFKNQVLGLIFFGNRAKFGGAIFVDDKSSSTAACTTNSECFLQYWSFKEAFDSSFIYFSKNSATRKGSNIYGGMLNRCKRNPFTGLKFFYNNLYAGVLYIKSISNIASNLDSISSLPVQVCFCNDQGYPDCNYQPSTVNVTKGETFNVLLVAVDQVKNPLDANISSYLISHDGRFDEGQQTQTVANSCTNLTFSIYSTNSFETLILYAEGPCADSKSSVRNLSISFSECTCPIGFEPSNNKLAKCECICDSKLSPYITLCNSSTSSLIRKGTNSWIVYVNDTDIPGFVIHPNCPFDYCHNQDENISINFNVLEGVDAQCANFRTGVLCGACQQDLSLSLGSSRCLPCHSHWPVVTTAILLAFIIAGILLVALLLALNLTVAIGLINGFIFYSNIIAAASSSAFFSSSKPTFPTVFVAWLNLDIGFDACFIDGLDAYTKTWLQLAFPVYVISLVVLIIICCTYFSKFATFIGKRDPVSTLATLILLSYAKLLSVTISVLSFAVLSYPDGTQTKIWLPDGNIKYCEGKHILLFVAALLIVLIGVPYTLLLFLWQWLVRLPKWRIFSWTRNTKLSAFITVYHAPYNDNYRYWTGLLLLVRVVLFITGAATVSKNPQVPLLMTIILVGGLLLHKGITRIYRKFLTDVVEMVIYFNILVLATFTLFEFKIDIRKQTAIMYMSTVITFLLFVGIVVYQMILLVRKKKVSEDINEVQSNTLIELSSSRFAEVTFSSTVEIPYRTLPSY